MLKPQDVEIYNRKPSCFVVFADLDGTFTPMDISGKIDFVNVIREIQERAGVQVKFVPVSGRPAGYVLRVLHDARDMLEGMNLGKVCDYGAAEQGALIVDSSKSYYPQYIGGDETLNLKQTVAEVIAKSKYNKIVKDEPDKMFTCSIHITNEAKGNMDRDSQRKVYESIRSDIFQVIDPNRLDTSMSHNCMEVMSKTISKSKAMDILLWRYRKDFNVVGILYAGDAENDRKAILHTTKLAEIGGMASHVFEPSNAQAVIDTQHLEKWKYENKAASRNRIKKSDLRLFKGITQLIRDELAKGTLCGRGTGVRRTVDDEALSMRKKANDDEEWDGFRIKPTKSRKLTSDGIPNANLIRESEEVEKKKKKKLKRRRTLPFHGEKPEFVKFIMKNDFHNHRRMILTELSVK